MKFSLIALATFALASTQVVAAPGGFDRRANIARSAEADALPDAEVAPAPAPDAHRGSYFSGNIPRDAEPEPRRGSYFGMNIPRDAEPEAHHGGFFGGNIPRDAEPEAHRGSFFGGNIPKQ